MTTVSKLFVSLLLLASCLMVSGVTFAEVGTGVDASGESTIVPLVALPGVTTSDVSSNDVAPTTLTSYLVGSVRFIVALSGALAFIMLIYAGTKYVAAGVNPSAKASAKGDITNAFIGLAIVLGSYLILSSINENLVNFNLKIPSLGKISQYTASNVTISDKVQEAQKYQEKLNSALDVVLAAEKGATHPGELGDFSPNTKEGTQLLERVGAALKRFNERTNLHDFTGYPWNQGQKDGDLAVRAELLKTPGISVNHDNCIVVGQGYYTDLGLPPCTSLYGIQDSLVQELKRQVSDCTQLFSKTAGSSCAVSITGGTEYWYHGNHATDITELSPNSHHRPYTKDFPNGGLTIDLSLGKDRYRDAEKFKAAVVESDQTDGILNFNRYIQAKGKDGANTTTPQCASGPRYVVNGVTYVAEYQTFEGKPTKNVDHWHVCFYK